MWSMSNNRYRHSMRLTMVAFGVALVGLLFPPLSSVEAQTTPTAQVVLLGPQQQVIAGLYQGSGANASTAIFLIHERHPLFSAGAKCRCCLSKSGDAWTPKRPI
jgi:hypothetical protein